MLALVTVLLIPGASQAQTPLNEDPTGRPRVFPSAEGAGLLFADTSGIGDPDGLRFFGPPDPNTNFGYDDWSYQWIRVDGDTASEINIGANSPTYQLVDADIGNLIKVKVSFKDRDNFDESVTSVPFGPIPEPAGPSLPPTTLVGNTGASHSVAAAISGQYAMPFRLGGHGQGYEISSVSIELDAVPSTLTVSLWIGSHPDHDASTFAQHKLFDFENPSSFQVGLNKFTAPAGTFAYQNVNYAIVLSGFGGSLSIRETGSDGEAGVPGAILFNDARVRGAGGTGRWGISTSRSNVLRLVLEGSGRGSGILASNYAQPGDAQEIISIGDQVGLPIRLGAADRYLIRGFSWVADNSSIVGNPMYNPFDLRSGGTFVPLGPSLVSLFPSRYGPGINVWTAPQGATVAGGRSYLLYEHYETRPLGVILSRTLGTSSDSVDTPTATDVSLSDGVGTFSGRPLMAFIGEALYAMVQNLERTDNSYVSVQGGSSKVLSQRFTTGPEAAGYRMLGIGVNIEGSDDTNGDAQIPASPTSVSVAVHAAKSDGRPGAKLFDLVSPTEFGPGVSFFEAPAGTTLNPSTSYVLVWIRNDSAFHRLQRTASDDEDSRSLAGFSIANAYYLGADLSSLTADSGGNSLEFAVYTDTEPRDATGRPRIFPSADGAGFLLADTSKLADPDGLPFTGSIGSFIDYVFSYQWIRVDGETAAETLIGSGSPTYQPVDADIGHLIKVRVSFRDKKGRFEALTSLPYGPFAEPAGPSAPSSTLVSNTGQSPSAAASITGGYTLGFRLGTHGQGYEISGVSIDLAAAPSSLNVSLWIAGVPGYEHANSRRYKLLDFTNPDTFKAGLNRFTAPAGVYAYPNVNYYIVLSDYGSSLSINETSSDDEDDGGETGAIIFDDANASGGSRSSMLRLAVEGSRRDRGILASTYAQPIALDDNNDPITHQEIISVGDVWAWRMVVGDADRFLVRGISFYGDDTTNRRGGFNNPYHLEDGGTRLFTLHNTRDYAGISLWTAPQGATVAGDDTYDFVTIVSGDDPDTTRWSAVLLRMFSSDSTAMDTPTAPGVTLSVKPGGDVAIPALMMAVLGEPLDAMVQNLGQTDNSYHSVGSASTKVAAQGFTTGSDTFGYRLQGIGVNIEGSSSDFPEDRASVSVAVHADSGGKPGRKLFDLVNPTESGAGHSFFEAPQGATLAPNSSYVLVWRHLAGSWHRLQKTSSDSEDSGAATGYSLANALYKGSNLNSLTVDSGGNSLEIAVYGEAFKTRRFLPGGYEVKLSWLHIPEDKSGEPVVEVGDQFRLLFVTYHGSDATSGAISDYNDLVRFEAAGRSKRYPEVNDITNRVIREVAPRFRAVVCTEDDDARDNTGMTDPLGVPIHWLDGGWENRPTLIANSYDEFFGGEWMNSDKGAYVTGNTMGFDSNEAIWTGCLSSGASHPEAHMGSSMGMVAVGTPRDANANNAPLGAVDVDVGYAAIETFDEIDGEEPRPVLKGIYAISPVFTVVE